MPFQNKVSTFLETRGISAYRMIKDSGISDSTGYKMARHSDYVPSIAVLEKICDFYQIDIGVLIERVEK